jgi:site-specific recombinase XerD
MKLHTAIEKYIGLKISLGFRFHADSVILRAFRRAMGSVKLGDVKPARVRAYLDGTGPLTRFWERKWVTLRGFYRFAQARGLVRQSPLPKVPPKPPPPFVPYIYSRAELRRLLAAIPTEPIAGLGPGTLRALLLLLYGAGLRLSEALNLNQAQVDLEAGLLTICQSKFFKTRWVPISPQLARVLARYRAPRPPRAGNRGRPFFRSVTGEPVRRSAAERQLSLNTQRSYRDSFVLLLSFAAKQSRQAVDRLHLEQLSPKLLRGFLQYLAQRRHCGPSTLNQRLAALRAWARFVGGHSPESTAWSGEVRALAFRKAAPPLLPYLERAEMQAVLDAPDPRRPQGRRDAVLLLFLYNTGARASEAVDLTIGDIDFAAPAITEKV